MNNNDKNHLDEYFGRTFNTDFNQAYNEIVKGKGYRHSDIFYSFAQLAARRTDEPLLLSVVGCMYFLWRKEDLNEADKPFDTTIAEFKCYSDIRALTSKVGVLAKLGYGDEPILYKIKSVSVTTVPYGKSGDRKITGMTFSCDSVRMSIFGIVQYGKANLNMEEFVGCLRQSLTDLHDRQRQVRILAMGFQNVKETMQASKCMTNKDAYEIKEALNVIVDKLEGKTAFMRGKTDETSYCKCFSAQKDISANKCVGLEINPIKSPTLRTLMDIIESIEPLQLSEKDSMMQQFTEIEKIINEFLNK